MPVYLFHPSKKANWQMLYFCLFLILFFSGCKKGGGDGSEEPTPPKPTKGQAIFFLKQDCNIGNVSVTLDSDTKLIRNWAAYKPDCDADSSYAIFTLEAGSYDFAASAGNLNWHGTLSVEAGECAGMQLTCDGVTPLLTGYAGTPRFHLQHPAGVDFDLHIVTPGGNEINWANTEADEGKMDLVSSCLGNDANPVGGLTLSTENVWFSPASAAHGTYKYWVTYGGYCGASPGNGTYTIQVINGLSAVDTKTGTLTPATTKSDVYTFEY